MAKSKTIHVIPRDGRWAVKREGTTGSTWATKGEAIEHARGAVKQSVSGQIVVHRQDGRIAEHVTYGMPRVQDPPKKSRLGTKNIEEAVRKVLFERLGADPTLG